jgi:hypothetical protein
MVLSAFGPLPSGVFFTGVATAPSELVPAQYPVAIAGHPYNIEPRLYRRRHLPIQRPPSDDSREPGEQTLSPEGLWRRSQSNWNLGANQKWLDERESVRERFYTSLGVEVMVENELSLLPETEEKRNSANSNLKILRVGLRFYVADGAVLIFSNGSGSEQNATWVTGWTTATGLPGGSILDIAYSGSHVYVLGSDNSIYRATPGTTAFTLYYNPTAVALRMWSGLGRLFMSDGRSFYEVTATPGETLILTHPDPNMVWSAMEAAPTGVYLGGNVGSDKGEVRHTWVNDAGTTFVAPVVAAEFNNETVNVLRSAGNNMLFGTSRGFRFAPISGQTTSLDFGPVTPLGPVRDIVTDTDTIASETFAYCTWDNIVSGTSGLAKIRLARTTEQRVLAYASDIYSTGGGSVLTVASLSGRRYFGVAADGFKGATANKVATGTLSTGRIRYGILDYKHFLSMQWRTEPLPAGAQVTWDAESDSGAAMVVGTQVNTSSTGSGDDLGFGPLTAEWIELNVVLSRATDTTVGPVLRWWQTNSVPAVSGVMQFIVPVRLHEKERTPLGMAKLINVFEERDFIMSLVHSRQIITYQEGRASYPVYVVNCEDQPDNWDTMQHNLEGIILVEMHTITT